MARLYATDADYKAFTGDATASASAVLLRTASGLVAHVTRFAPYETDATHMPTDADVVEAFTEAVCTQVEFWQTRGETTGHGDAESDLASLTIKGLSWSRNPNALPTTGVLCSTAWMVLDTAGLTSVHLSR